MEKETEVNKIIILKPTLPAASQINITLTGNTELI